MVDLCLREFMDILYSETSEKETLQNHETVETQLALGLCTSHGGKLGRRRKVMPWRRPRTPRSAYKVTSYHIGLYLEDLSEDEKIIPK